MLQIKIIQQGFVGWL